jgi:predicted nucleic acid-binding protein
LANGANSATASSIAGNNRPCPSSSVRFLRNTNILIGVLKQDKDTVDQLHLNRIEPHQAGYSTITRMELLGFPGLQQAEKAVITNLLEALTYYPVSRQAEDRTIEIRGVTRLKLPDAIILATAQAKVSHS